MNLQLNYAELRLKTGNLLTLDDSLDARIDCIEGSLWITQDGDPRDVMLADGRSYRIDRTSRVVVFATSDACLQISSQPAASKRLSNASPGWLARLTGTSPVSVSGNHCAL